MLVKSRHSSHHLTMPPKHHLGLFIICLILTIIFTVFTIWFNLKKETTSEQGLFEYIQEKFEEGLSEKNPLINL